MLHGCVTGTVQSAHVEQGGQMRSWLVGVLVALVMPLGFVGSAQAAQGAAKQFTSCDRLLSEYPNGVARSKKAANAAVRDGFARPKVSAAVYKTNSGRLDRDKDGVMCEQGGTSRGSQGSGSDFTSSRDFCLGKAVIDRWDIPSSCNGVLRDDYATQEWCRGAKVIYGKVPDYCN